MDRIAMLAMTSVPIIFMASTRSVTAGPMMERISIAPIRTARTIKALSYKRL